MFPYQSDEIQQQLWLERLGAWLMSFVCGLLLLLALVAASRLPLYLAEVDYVRAVGVILFVALASGGLVANLRHHLCLRRRAIENSLI